MDEESIFYVFIKIDFYRRCSK